mgnify:CR=1 FL=1
MSVQMKGMDVANAMKESLIARVEKLKEQGVAPCLAMVRVGNRPDDMSYERGAKKRLESVGVSYRVVELPDDISQETFEAEFRKVNENPEIHGILLFRPLPKHLNEEPIKRLLNPEKDMDGMTSENIAKIFAGDESGYAPCTAEAVMEMLDYYKIDLTGKKAIVVGRSMVVGRPLAMMFLKKNATVTMCHTKTVELAKTCREAEVLVAAVGKARMITADMVKEGAVVVDVGINVDEQGNLCGDVDFEQAESRTSYISPVPKGVGSITTSVLAKHVIRAAEKTIEC